MIGLGMLRVVPDFGRRGRMRSFHPMHPVTFTWGGGDTARQGDELDTCGEPFRVLPPWQRIPLIGPQNPEQPGSGKPSSHRFGRFIRKRGSGLMQFVAVHHCPGEFLGREFQHFTTVFARGWRGCRLVRRNPAWQETHLIEFQGLAREIRQMEVTEVDRVKRASEQADLAGGGHVGWVGALRAAGTMASFIAL